MGKAGFRGRARSGNLVGMALAAALAAAPAQAADHVKMSAFQGTFVNFPVYVAKDLKLFEKHGLDVELVYGTGIQVANIMVSGSADFGAFAVEHGLILQSKGQDVKLLVVDQTLPPFNIIVRNDVPTPNAGKPYPAMLKDLKGLKIGISTPGASTDLTLTYLLKQAGLDRQKDVTIVPVGGPSTEVAGIKNGLVDALIAIEPAQTEAVLGLKIARPILDIQHGEGPEVFHEYAYNAVFVRPAYLMAHADTARAIVASIVDAEALINDPAHLDDIAKIAQDNMRGIDPQLLRVFLQSRHSIFAPVATPAAIAHVSEILVGAGQIPKPVPFEQIVAQDFMPHDFPAAKTQ